MQNMSARDDRKNINIAGILLFLPVYLVLHASGLLEL